jgi:NAD(P)-dependent dehydrogenase (short-subunit alcohol dehydrogenase family)
VAGITKEGPRAVLVTGCSSGIGECLAHGLRDRGYRVLATARRDEDLQRLEAAGVEPLHLELADPDSVARCAETALERTDGRLWGLVNNAAYGQPGAVEDLDRDLLRRQLEVNLLGTHDLTRRILPALRAQGAGRVVQMSSVLGLIALRYRGAYNTSKFALEGLTDTLRLELAGTGVQVSLVEPGPITSRFRENSLAAFRANIDAEHSAYRDTYRDVAARLTSEGEGAFTLGPEAVLKQTVRALEARRPKPRYYVTFPTYLFGTLRRLLPATWLDHLLRQVD